MGTKMVKNQIDNYTKSYDSGELDETINSIIPFLKTQKNEIQNFINSFIESNGKQTLESLIKYYILSCNKPFNLKSYLCKQSKQMEEDIGPEIKTEKRSGLVSDWIETEAENYRANSIMEQVYCFDRVKAKLIPKIEKELHLKY